MKFKIKTLENDIKEIDEVVGCRFYHVPLKEVVGEFWCTVLKRYVNVHAIEVFELSCKYSVGKNKELGFYYEEYKKELKSLGLSRETLHYKAKND